MSGTASTLWYFGDWLSDPGIRASSLAARGLWMDLLSIAGSNKGRDHGFIVIGGRIPSAGEIGRTVGSTAIEVESLLRELEDNGVFNRDRRGAIYSRRMVRTEKNRKNGKLGGNPKLLKNKDNANSLKLDGARGSRGPGVGNENLFNVEDSQEERSRRRRQRFTMPEDWLPSAIGRRFAEKHGFGPLDVEIMGPSCREHHISRGTEIADLEATWRTWVLKEVKFRRTNKSTRSASRSGGMAQVHMMLRGGSDASDADG